MFRAHPDLNAIPNELFNNGLLVNGADPSDGQLLLDVCKAPNPTIALVVVTVHGTSSRSLTGSHSNPTEAQVCRDIVHALMAEQVPAASVGIITFYKKQYRLWSSTLRSKE
ncbi:hypothetical protein ANCCEY_06603 [Ancylostoma ceylanicum]|uniref:DNA2/NAM7 helicase-like C-terminal domain-containing protein n=2 Tax=Ancylostoma ceylanicum TaxID=53326 RepID=A0A0D6LW40_9BILA|nr:hypothetical protein ANCCEY_06603 [Ancylostoma ceylanicum]EYB98517.1 hypothetical protein Y032_0131g1674 [Ancylostoma ceylanicum]